jgi:N-acetylmuramic acid 6-phosphate (MurNAc-6-P) etherase
LLNEAGGEVKAAIVMGLLGVPVTAAREKLAATNGVVRQALK